MKQRRCRRCGPTAYRKERPPGAVRSRFVCVACGGHTRPAHRRQPKAERSPLRRLKDRADELWSLIIRHRAQGRCQRCGKARAALQAAHNIGRGHCLATRHDLENGLALDGGCHRLIDEVPEEKRALFLRHLGAERYGRLELIRQAHGVKVDLQLVVLDLEATARKEGVPCSG